MRITGRLKDIVIRNAENISVVEIEELLFRHPAVADATVLGLPDAPHRRARVRGRRAARRRDARPRGAARALPRARASSLQKCPEQLEIVDELPRNAMGKVLKQELRSRIPRAGQRSRRMSTIDGVAETLVRQFDRMVKRDGGSVSLLGVDGEVIRVGYKPGVDPDCDERRRASCRTSSCKQLMAETLARRRDPTLRVVVELVS